MTITGDIKYIGVNDHEIDLFEGMYAAPNGMSYNSYLISDEKTAVMDAVDIGFAKEWLGNIQKLLCDKKPDFLIIQHMEPDHSASIVDFLECYPDTMLVASEKAFTMLDNFYGVEIGRNRMVVSDGDMLSLGRHRLVFVAAPMVHWPEVIMTYDSTERILFSADGFGKFGALDVADDWVKEARRYYVGIVSKYGVYVQKLLQKIADWDIKVICPLHGPVLSQNIEKYLALYKAWSAYQPEEEGVLIAYTSVYGNTKAAVMLLKEKLLERGCKVEVRDIARCDMSEAVAEAFRYSKLVLATTTYNAGIFPPMREYINSLTERNFSNRTVALIENGSWAVIAARLMRQQLEGCKGIRFADTQVKIVSSLNGESIVQLGLLAEELK